MKRMNLFVQHLFKRMNSRTRSAPTLQIHEGDLDFYASYEALSNVIHVDVEKIYQVDLIFQFEDILGDIDISVEDYAEIILAHEFGHVMDRKRLLMTMPKEQKWLKQLEGTSSSEVKERLIKQILALNKVLEWNAWQNGKHFVRNELIEAYNLINEDAIARHITYAERKLLHPIAMS